MKCLPRAQFNSHGPVLILKPKRLNCHLLALPKPCLPFPFCESPFPPAWPNPTLRCVSFLSPEHDGLWLVPFSWIIPNINHTRTSLTAVTDIHELAFKQSSCKFLLGPSWQKYSKFVKNIRSEWWELVQNPEKILTRENKKAVLFS